MTGLVLRGPLRRIAGLMTLMIYLCGVGVGQELGNLQTQDHLPTTLVLFCLTALAVAVAALAVRMIRRSSQ